MTMVSSFYVEKCKISDSYIRCRFWASHFNCYLREKMKEWIESSLGYSRFSPEFLRQLTEHGANKVGNYYNKYTTQYEEIYYNVFVILDKIKQLEENAFNKNVYKPLRNFGIDNLFHIHHVQPSHIALNCINELKKKAGSLKMSEDEYEKLVYDTLFLYYYVIEKFDENKANQYALGRMGQIFTDDGYLKRHEEKRLTGDWIVLYRKDNQNYYLTLARHEEPDEQIKERVVEALNSFSFN